MNKRCRKIKIRKNSAIKYENTYKCFIAIVSIIITVMSSIVNAICRLFYKGYFEYWNIDTGYISPVSTKNVFYFIGCGVFAITLIISNIIISQTANSTINLKQKLKRKNNKLWDKLLNFLGIQIQAFKMSAKYYILSLLVLLIGMGVLTIMLPVSNVAFKRIFGIVTSYILVNIVIYEAFSYSEANFQTQTTIKSIEGSNDSIIWSLLHGNFKPIKIRKVIIRMSVGFICLSLILFVGSYFGGKHYAETQRVFDIVMIDNTTYVVVHNNGNELILKEAEIDELTMNVITSRQTVVSVSDVITKKSRFISVKREDIHYYKQYFAEEQKVCDFT